MGGPASPERGPSETPISQAYHYSNSDGLTDDFSDDAMGKLFGYMRLNAFFGNVGETIRFGLFQHGPKCTAPF